MLSCAYVYFCCMMMGIYKRCQFCVLTRPFFRWQTSVICMRESRFWNWPQRSSTLQRWAPCVKTKRERERERQAAMQEIRFRITVRIRSSLQSKVKFRIVLRLRLGLQWRHRMDNIINLILFSLSHYFPFSAARGKFSCVHQVHIGIPRGFSEHPTGHHGESVFNWLLE